MTQVDPDNEATYCVCVIKSEQSETELPKQAILAQLKRYRFSDEALFGIKLALEEALTNAVKHGNGSDPNKKVTVRYAVNADKAVFVIRDEGRGFIPDEIPDPTTADRLALPEGRGIMLIRAYMDELVFRDHGREIYFAKYRK